MQIRYEPVNDNTDIFALYKNAMKPFVLQLFGWDEEFQNSGFTKHLLPVHFRWVMIDGIKVGIVCLQRVNQEIKLSLLIIFESFRKKGYGRMLMEDIMSNLTAGEILCWNCLKNNLPAIALYSRIENAECRETEHYYSYRFEKC